MDQIHEEVPTRGLNGRSRAWAKSTRIIHLMHRRKRISYCLWQCCDCDCEKLKRFWNRINNGVFSLWHNTVWICYPNNWSIISMNVTKRIESFANRNLKQKLRAVIWGYCWSKKKWKNGFMKNFGIRKTKERHGATTMSTYKTDSGCTTKNVTVNGESTMRCLSCIWKSGMETYTSN